MNKEARNVPKYDVRVKKLLLAVGVLALAMKEVDEVLTALKIYGKVDIMSTGDQEQELQKRS